MQRVNAATNEEQAHFLDNNNQNGEMAGYVESLVSTLVSNSKVKASVPVPDARVEKENTNGSLNEKHALEPENSGACDNRTQENVDQLDLDKAIRYRELNSLTISDAGKRINSKTVMDTFQLISTAPLKRVDDVNSREEAKRLKSLKDSIMNYRPDLRRL